MPTATPFLPAEAVESLLKGSHQHLAVRLTEAVQASLSQYQWGEAHLLATFDKKAVVMSDAGDVYSLPFTEERGELVLGTPQMLPVAGITSKNLRRFVQQEAKAAVDLFLQGFTSKAHEKISQLRPLVDASTMLSDEEIVENFVAKRAEGTRWKALIESRATQVTTLLGEDASSGPVQAQTSDLEGTQQGMGEILARLGVVEEQARLALQTLGALKDAAAAEGGAAAFQQLAEYTADLHKDVRAVMDFAEEALRDFKQVDLLAQLFDSMAGEVASFEVAGAFAAKMASRLADAGR